MAVQRSLDAHTLDERIFELINGQLEAKGLMVKKGTIVDATILPSSGRPLSDKKRQQLREKPSSQIDTDAKATKKGGRYYFGYKGHIGVDIESKLIRKVTFTPANRHDSPQTEKLISYDEQALVGDKAYPAATTNIRPDTTVGSMGCWTKLNGASRCQVHRKNETANWAGFGQRSSIRLPG